MSHGKRRKETDCLNCGSELQGPFCHYCGQENLIPKETALGLVSHFVYDITHFDGKFFSSIKYLLFKPGFLAKEYMRGRRASYLNPIRMYVFTSAFFFIIVFSITKTEGVFSEDTADTLSKQRLEIIEEIKTEKDSAELDELTKKLRKSDTAIIALEKTGVIEKSPLIPDSLRASISPEVQRKTNISVFNARLPGTLREYDSAQAALPANRRDGWIKHFLARRSLQINSKYQHRPSELKEKFVEKFFHSLPKLMFVSLPFVAWFLSILYFRRKQFYYVNHAIHIIYIYIAIYLLILFGYLFSWLYSTVHWQVFSWLQTATVILSFFYIYKSFRNFYQQSRLKTIGKYLLFLTATFLLFALLAVVFVLNSFLTI